MIGKFSINILLQSFNQADETPRDSFENKIVSLKAKKGSILLLSSLQSWKNKNISAEITTIINIKL